MHKYITVLFFCFLLTFDTVYAAEKKKTNLAISLKAELFNKAANLLVPMILYCIFTYIYSKHLPISESNPLDITEQASKDNTLLFKIKKLHITNISVSDETRDIFDVNFGSNKIDFNISNLKLKLGLAYKVGFSESAANIIGTVNKLNTHITLTVDSNYKPKLDVDVDDADISLDITDNDVLNALKPLITWLLPSILRTILKNKLGNVFDDVTMIVFFCFLFL